MWVVSLSRRAACARRGPAPRCAAPLTHPIYAPPHARPTHALPPACLGTPHADTWRRRALLDSPIKELKALIADKEAIIVLYRQKIMAQILVQVRKVNDLFVLAAPQHSGHGGSPADRALQEAAQRMQRALRAKDDEVIREERDEVKRKQRKADAEQKQAAFKQAQQAAVQQDEDEDAFNNDAIAAADAAAEALSQQSSASSGSGSSSQAAAAASPAAGGSSSSSSSAGEEEYTGRNQ